MCKNFLSGLFIIAFLQTGISKSSIVTNFRQKGDMLILICSLTGNESLTQINWESIQGANRTMLGIFHPTFGIFITPQHSETVTIQGSNISKASSELSIKNVSDHGEICCQFVTFPSGSLKKCFDLNSTVTEANAQVAHSRKLGLLRQLGALTVGCISCLLFLSITVYFCQRYRRKRKKVLEIQLAFQTDSSPTETYTENAPEVQNSPSPAASGFDPKKLYAKIKEDLYYGRLWKAYQGSERISTQGCLSSPRRIYYLLGEPPLAQMNENCISQNPNGTESSLDITS